MQDRFFDGLSAKFERQIYAGVKGQLRLALLQRDLDQAITDLSVSSLPFNLLDAGGGTGQFCARLACRGQSRITFCEPSAEMIALARRAFVRQAPYAQVRFLQQPLQQLPHYLKQPQDLVLFHAVIEWLADPESALTRLAQLIRPGGWFSVLFYNARALHWQHLCNGNWDKLYSGSLKGRKNSLTPINPQYPETVEAILQSLGFEIHRNTAIRTIVDSMKPFELAKKSFTELLEAEASLGQQEPYRQLARYIHLLARKPLHTCSEKTD